MLGRELSRSLGCSGKLDSLQHSFPKATVCDDPATNCLLQQCKKMHARLRPRFITAHPRRR